MTYFNELMNEADMVPIRHDSYTYQSLLEIEKSLIIVNSSMEQIGYSLRFLQSNVNWENFFSSPSNNAKFRIVLLDHANSISINFFDHKTLRSILNDYDNQMLKLIQNN